MIATLHPTNFMLRPTALNLTGMFAFAVTLCVAFPFFLVVVSIGTASAGAYALGTRWNKRRRKRPVGKRKC